MTKSSTDGRPSEAQRRGNAKAKLPTALMSATLDESAKKIRLCFRSGLEMSVPVKAINEIANVTLARLRDVAPSPMGDGLIFNDADVAIYMPGLMRDLFGHVVAGGRERKSVGGA